MIDYNKRLVEVDEVLRYLSAEDLAKIPDDIRQLIKENKDKDYVWKYDETKPLKDQNLSRDTIAFLSYLNMEYLLDEEQKELMEQIHMFNEKKLEEEKSKKYNKDDLFNKKKSLQIEEKQTQINEQILVPYKETFFKRIIKKIKKIFQDNK